MISDGNVRPLDGAAPTDGAVSRAAQGPAAASSHPPTALPDSPLVTIEPSRGWVALGLRDLWGYRDLLYFLTWRDVKVRYKQTVLGAAWAVLQPLFTTLIFTLIFGRLAGLPSDGIPYPVFFYAGLLPWTFFANAVTSSSNSLVGSAGLITKIYFPRMIIPAAAVAAGAVDFAIAFVILVGMLLYYGIAPSWGLLMLLPLVIILMLAALGVGMWLSALNVKYRDIRFALPFIVQLWMFASPVIYPASMLPEKWRWVFNVNPMTGVIEGFRAALLHNKGFDWPALAFSAAVTIVALVYAAYAFRRMERSFADVV